MIIENAEGNPEIIGVYSISSYTSRNLYFCAIRVSTISNYITKTMQDELNPDNFIEVEKRHSKGICTYR